MLPDNISDSLQLIASGSCMALLVAAAIGDVKRYRISNNLVGAVIACFVVLAAANASWIFVGWSLAAAACALAVIAGRWLESMLVGTAPSDPLVLGAAAIVMLSVAGVATFLPARTASRADPTALLRAE